eukprot:8056229-Heterocapsa_arctica.AAC.1
MAGWCLFLHVHRLDLSDPVHDDQCLFEDGGVNLLQSDLRHLLVRAHDVLDALEPLVDRLHRWL